jgi:hypothetical protein
MGCISSSSCPPWPSPPWHSSLKWYRLLFFLSFWQQRAAKKESPEQICSVQNLHLTIETCTTSLRLRIFHTHTHTHTQKKKVLILVVLHVLFFLPWHRHVLSSQLHLQLDRASWFLNFFLLASPVNLSSGVLLPLWVVLWFSQEICFLWVPNSTISKLFV